MSPPDYKFGNRICRQKADNKKKTPTKGKFTDPPKKHFLKKIPEKKKKKRKNLTKQNKTKTKNKKTKKQKNKKTKQNKTKKPNNNN